MIFLIFLAIPFTVTALGLCDNLPLAQCIDANLRPDWICGQGNMCPNRQPCYWCTAIDGGEGGSCQEYDICAGKPDNSTCLNGQIIVSENSWDCEHIRTSRNVFLGLASIIPSLSFAYFFYEMEGLHYKPMIACLAFISIFPIFICLVVQKNDVYTWGFLWLPTLVLPIGLIFFGNMIHRIQTICHRRNYQSLP